MDNVFIERRSLKHEDIYLKGYADGREAHAGIAAWFAFYNSRRPHQALGSCTPMAAWREGIGWIPRHSCGHDAALGQR
jgi:putative transposase